MFVLQNISSKEKIYRLTKIIHLLYANGVHQVILNKL